MKIGTLREIWRYPVKSMAGEQLESARVAANGIELDRTWAIRDVAKGECRGAKAWPVLLDCVAHYRDPADAPSASASSQSSTAAHSPPVNLTLPDGTQLSSDDPEVHERLSALLGSKVTFEPLRPAADRDFYRRAAPGSALLGRLGKSKRFVRGVQAFMKVARLDGELREDFSREEGEPLPDLSDLPPEVLEFTSPPGTFFDAFPIHVLTTASLDAMKQLHPDGEWDRRRFRPNLLIDSGDAEGQIDAGWSGRTLRVGNLQIRCTVPTMRCGMTMHAQDALPRDPQVLRTIVREADQCLGIYANVLEPATVNLGDEVFIE